MSKIIAVTTYALGLLSLVTLISIQGVVAGEGNDFEKQLLVKYAQTAITEFCYRSKIQECKDVKEKISKYNHELFSYGNNPVEQNLVLFGCAEKSFYPYAIFAFDKDGWIKILVRGIHMGEREKFINTFEEEGNFAE